MNNTANARCRTCLEESSNLKSMLIIENDTTNLWNMYDYLMNVSENVAGDFLLNICLKCEESLKSAYLFKLMCIETEKTLSKFSTNNEKTISFQSDCESELECINFEDNGTADALESEAEVGEDFWNKLSEAVSDQNDTGEQVTVETFTHKVKKRKCKLCKLNFQDLKAYQVHYRQFHPVDKVVCSFCGKLIAKHSIDKHLNSHSSEKIKNHLCTVCGSSFTLIENLRKHLRIHSNDKRYTCEHCGEKFIHWNSKRSHIRAKHTREKKYECNICQKKFAQSSNMFRHIRQHTNDLRHTCTFCTKRFQTKTELNNHLVVHTKVKNEICFECFKCFGTRKALNAHSKVHTGERNYMCTVCNKTFTQPHVLRTHLKTHPGCEIPPPGVILSRKALEKHLPNETKTIDES